MSNYTRNDVSTISGVNAELEKVAVAMQEHLDREPSGGQANQMNAALDMNAQDVLNVGNITASGGETFATEAYVTAGDDATLQAAKDYTYPQATIDSKDSATLSSAQGYTYPQATIDSKDTATLASAKAYTDSSLTNYTLTTSVDSKDAATLVSANAYTDANAVLITGVQDVGGAKTFTDDVTFESNLYSVFFELKNVGDPLLIQVDAFSGWASTTTTAGFQEHLYFVNPNGEVGSITTNGTATSFTTSSDPRLKDFLPAPTEQEVNTKFNALNDAFAVFKWKNDSNSLVWGFDAHKAIDSGLDMGVEGKGSRVLELGTELTPETVDEEGNITLATKVTPAGVDQSKAVPILVAKIAQLEARLEALEV